MPIPTPSEIISARLNKLDSQILQSIDALTEEEVSKWIAPTAPSCKWHLWHMARWADYVQSLLSGVVDVKTPELWEFAGVVDEWGFTGVNLGMWGAGSGLGNESGHSLPLPSVAKVRSYAQEAFDLLEKRVGKLEDASFNAAFTDWHDNETNVGDAMVGYIAHANRHLGMLEALTGILGKEGTATV
ncbi:MAG: DinB family protein [Chloroflexi bacterium]|nr:DinB family protein [Chloroflexota bacterium]